MAALTAREVRDRIRAKAEADRRIREAAVLQLAGLLERRAEAARSLETLDRAAGDAVRAAVAVMSMVELAEFTGIELAQLRRLHRLEPGAAVVSEPQPSAGRVESEPSAGRIEPQLSAGRVEPEGVVEGEVLRAVIAPSGG